MTAYDLKCALKHKLKTYDRNGVSEICEQLISNLYEPATPFDVKTGKEIMRDLRNNLQFDLVQQVGEALILTNRSNFTIRKLYAQSLIDQNFLAAAISVLNQLISDAQHEPDTNMEAKAEEMEARGLLGRSFKQIYINKYGAANPNLHAFLQLAIKTYYEVYDTNRTVFTWHGINVVALLIRAKKDKITIDTKFDPLELATAILQVIEAKYDRQEADAWDFATAAEACIALQDAKNALEWISGYARMPYIDAFQLRSTLRQLEEVWQLDVNSEMGSLLLPIIRAELLKSQGGTVVIDANDVQYQKTITKTYQQLINAVEVTDNSTARLEKVFSYDSFSSYDWYKTGIDRCLAVARIGRETNKGMGTGFLLQGKALHEKLGTELVLITNAHVVSNDPAENKKGALHSDEAVVIFEILNYQEKFTIKEIIWSSPSTELDVTILRFDEEGLVRLQKLTENIAIYPVSLYQPMVSNEKANNRIYIIGHPAGGTLQLSLYDNVLLDSEDPRIHYRTPTIGGSSGSPVFNQNWQLIGLHHAGSKDMPMLNGKPGRYEANEGIWIQAIKRGLSDFFEH
ncbi:hypothetical protein A4H97_13765 [Niastella yeongjuensis]|uniref:Serine protease n=1 Tax=Niastella yeongjuensis TaxID=354355 RepID=A0A1V9E3L6_9BACT|nr:serine protease [Niastella yeongjuensis]OQP40686.1 hypothetical protein A4H97_13765 [Niastella yeongjuensis]SEP04599.1 Trypsin-like peptidase domain-containing protein [Niastella yeongjuensis]